MIPSISNDFLRRNDFVIHKGRKIDRILIEFVVTVLHIQLHIAYLEHEAPFTVGELFQPALWDHLRRWERCQVGLCMSWLVDHGHTPLVKFPTRRNNRLTYRFTR